MSEEHKLPKKDETELNPRDTEMLPAVPGERTTYNVKDAAQQALARYNAELELRRQQEAVETQEIEKQITLKIKIEGVETPIGITVTIENSVTIGRRDPTKEETPGIDLTPHGAYQMGISRNHAEIKIKDQRLFVVDLNSRNGTYVNGKRVEPQSPIKLRNNDELRLGKIVMRLQFQTIS
ncbi:MAG: FHA domain-containing protein [Aggregatilineales bacterium]